MSSETRVKNYVKQRVETLIAGLIVTSALTIVSLILPRFISQIWVYPLAVISTVLNFIFAFVLAIFFVEFSKEIGNVWK